MTKLEYVLKGFIELNEEEKKEFLNRLKEYEKYPYRTGDKIKKSLSEERHKFSVNFGPAPSSCPCCGK